MARILFTLFTLLCFTGCSTLGPRFDGPPPPLEHQEQAQAGESAPAARGNTALWTVIGIVALIALVVVVADDDGKGNGGAGY